MSAGHEAMFRWLALLPPAARAALLASHRQGLDHQLTSVGALLAEGQHAAATPLVHQMAGSAGMMQDAALAQAARQLERALRAGQLQDALRLWPQVADAAAATLAALAAHDAAAPLHSAG